MTDRLRKPEIRKARTPVAFVSPALFDGGGSLRCKVTYEPSNGTPSHAMLLPVCAHLARWRVTDAAGAPIERPGPEDIHTLPLPLNASADDSLHGVDVLLPWPGTSDYALLLLLYGQVENIGDDADVQTYESRVSQDAPAPETRLRPMSRPVDAVLRCLRSEPASSLERGVVHRSSDRARASRASLGPASGTLPFSFALASCQYPAGVLDGGIRSQREVLEEQDLGPAEISLWRLAERLRREPAISFTVLAGDQVYVDATAGLFDTKVLLDRFSFAYDRMFQNRGLQRLLRFGGADVIPMLDDHEIDDNWEPLPRPPNVAKDNKEKLLATAQQQYLSRQRAMWPLAREDGRLYQAARIHGAPIFFADTRTEREGRSLANYARARFVSDEQGSALKRWIKGQADEGIPFFVVSASILLPRRLALVGRAAMAVHNDSWAGYPRSLYELLAWCFDARANRLVFLSGDEHLSCLAVISLTCRETPGVLVRLHSIHSSALYAPYPFANSIPQDFADPDVFDFEHEDDTGLRRFSCSVTTFFPQTEDGFTLLSARPTSAGWTVTVEFDGQAGLVSKALEI